MQKVYLDSYENLHVFSPLLGEKEWVGCRQLKKWLFRVERYTFSVHDKGKLPSVSDVLAAYLVEKHFNDYHRWSQKMILCHDVKELEFYLLWNGPKARVYLDRINNALSS